MRFIFPLPPQSRSFLSLESSRGVVAAVQGHGPPKMHVWGSLESFCGSSHTFFTFGAPRLSAEEKLG